MSDQRGFAWGPSPLPAFLQTQLDNQGFRPGDQGRCADLLNAQPGAASSAPLFVNLGALNLLAGDIDGAVAAWRHAISSHDDVAASLALLNLGLLYEHLHLYERAIGVLSSVAERAVYPSVASAAMAKARCQRATGDLDAAMETMARLAQEMMAEHPDAEDLADTLYGLGDVALQAGRLDRAERAWRVAAAGPDSLAQQSASNRLIQLWLDQGHDDELVELLESPSVGVLDAHAPALLDRVESLHVLGHEDQAVALAGRLGGEDLAAKDRFRLAEVRLQIGLVNEAIDELEVLLSARSVDVQQRAAFSLGEVYRSYEMGDAAATMYGRVIDESDRYWSPKAALALGDLCADGGDQVAAAQHWNTAAAGSVAVVCRAAEQRLNRAGTETFAPVLAEPVGSNVLASDPGSQPVIALVAEDQIAVLSEDVVESEVILDLVMIEEVTTEPSSVPAPTAMPIVVNLNELEDTEVFEPVPLDTLPLDSELLRPSDLADGLPNLDELPTDMTPSDIIGEPSPSASFFARQLEEPAESASNPYAALAPDGHEDDVEVSARNPYAELAPNYATDDFVPASDVEPGDWESMLDGWPKRTEDDDSGAESTKSSSAFSRYT